MGAMSGVGKRMPNHLQNLDASCRRAALRPRFLWSTCDRAIGKRRPCWLIGFRTGKRIPEPAFSLSCQLNALQNERIPLGVVQAHRDRTIRCSRGKYACFDAIRFQTACVHEVVDEKRQLIDATARARDRAWRARACARANRRLSAPAEGSPARPWRSSPRRQINSADPTADAWSAQVYPRTDADHPEHHGLCHSRCDSSRTGCSAER